MTTRFSDRLLDSLASFFEALLRFLPALAAALLIFCLGLLAGWVLRRLVTHFLRVTRFDRACDGAGVLQLLARADIRASPSVLVGRGVFWLVFASFTMAAMAALQVSFIDQLVAEFFLYLPRVLSALLVVLAGFLLGGFLGRAALLTAANAGLPSPRLLALVVKLLVSVIALAMALEQLRIATSIVLAAFIIAFGSVMLGLALAFGLGGREVARRLLERHLEQSPGRDSDNLSHL